MSDRGPKYGWTLGGLGSVLWLIILAAVLLIKGNFAGFLCGILFFALCIGYLYFFAPWKYPRTPFRRIYLGFVSILVFAAFMMMVLWDPRNAVGWQDYRILLPLCSLLIPVFVFGGKTWDDMYQTVDKQ